MKKQIKNIIFPILCLLVLLIGILCGVQWRHYKDSKTVVFRISTDKKFIDYDLKTAINYLQYQFEKMGYTVLPWRYPGAFYHQKGDNAAINIFIRSNAFFYDTRMNKDALDIYYLHRFFYIYGEEMQGYDYYLSSQQNLKDALRNYPNVGYFGVGAIPHQKLTPQYKYDVLYIAENINPQYMAFLEQNYQVEHYNSLTFGRLTEDEIKAKLAQARLVIYDKEPSSQDDADYVPYAVYDIIGYGRPLMTNASAPLHKTFANDIYLYQNEQELFAKVSQALKESDDIREQKADRARQKALDASKNTVLELPEKK